MKGLIISFNLFFTNLYLFVTSFQKKIISFKLKSNLIVPMNKQDLINKIVNENVSFVEEDIKKLIDKIEEAEIGGFSQVVDNKQVQVFLNGFGKIKSIKGDVTDVKMYEQAFNTAFNNYLNWLETFYNFKSDLNIFDILSIITRYS